MEFHSLMLFALASLTLNLIPGPDVVFIVSNTMRGKMKAGIQASLGLGVGYLFHTLAAVVGLSALVLSSAFLFSLVKYLGAAYLLYLGISSLRNFISGKSKICIDARSEGQGKGNVFKQGVIVSVLNPKVAMFFLSFLPQFVDPTLSNTTYQFLTLGLLFSGLAMMCNVMYAILGSLLFNSPKVSRYTRMIEGISGVLLIGLATKIAFNKN